MHLISRHQSANAITATAIQLSMQLNWKPGTTEFRTLHFHWPLYEENLPKIIRGWLHGFIILSPGWIFLRFVASFSPGFPTAAILFRWINHHFACPTSRFSPGGNLSAITWGFSAFQSGLRCSPGWNSLHASNRKRLLRRSELKSQLGLKFAIKSALKTNKHSPDRGGLQKTRKPAAIIQNPRHGARCDTCTDLNSSIMKEDTISPSAILNMITTAAREG